MNWINFIVNPVSINKTKLFFYYEYGWEFYDTLITLLCNIFRVSIYKEKHSKINHSCGWLLFLNYTDVLFMSVFFILETSRKTLTFFLTCSSFIDISHIRYFLNNAICTAHACLISCKKPYSDTSSYLSQHCLLIIHAAQLHQRSFHQSVSPW